MMAAAVSQEHPIVFSDLEVRAVLEGWKTQTRRIVKPQPEYRSVEGLFNSWQFRRKGGGWWLYPNGKDAVIESCPYGKPGDRLWVREGFALQSCCDGEPPLFTDSRPVKLRPDHDDDCLEPEWLQPHYRATDPEPELCCEDEHCRQCRDNDFGPHWQPSIHMPRWASRITLEITEVRVQRVQEISEEDAIAEGIRRQRLPDLASNRFHWGDTTHDRCKTAIAAFQALWDSINAKRGFGWESNPWVWAITFRRLTP